MCIICDLIDKSLPVTSFIKNQKGWLMNAFDHIDEFCFIGIIQPNIMISLCADANFGHIVTDLDTDIEYEFKNITDLIAFLNTL